MSKKRIEIITCPECGRKMEFVVWDSLNGDINPYEKNQLLSGTLFRYKCSQCGREADIAYNMLYHDMRHGVMVSYVTHEEMVKDAIEAIEKAHVLSQKSTAALGITPLKTKHRVVTDVNRLREKAIIFDAGLDDRVVEIVKLFCWLEVSKVHNDVRDDELFFFIRNDIYEVIVPRVDLVCDARMMYDAMAKDFKPLLDAVGDDNYIVDNNYAGNILLGLRKMQEKAEND